MKSPQATAAAPTKSKSRRGKDNPAQQPRIHQIFAIMQHNDRDPNPEKRYPTLGQIAKMIQGNDPKPLSNDTIARILDMMRDDWNLPVDFIPARGGHGFTEPVAGFPLDVIKEEEVYLLIQSVQALGVFRESKAYREIRKAVKKACLGITVALGIEFEDIEKALSFHVVGFDAPAPVDPELFKAAMRAILQKQEVTLEHRSAKRPGEVKQKTVEPLHLSMINHALYLWHHDPELEGKRDADGKPVDPIRKFALTRIGKFSTTGKKAKVRKFNIQERLDRGMGAFDDENLADVELHFTPKITPFILERPWHRSQTTEMRADGGVTLRLRVACTPELDAFIMRWAGEVEVVTPGKLRKRMWELGKALMEAHREEAVLKEAMAEMGT